ncbi:hypothetical protein [Acidipila rosea]|uniref:Tail protein n=1 Tax=Acidipila rosea TaxID=768535 RepID=A0A4R1L1X5_9BACT|nr:hypothetical protein [Acidipila rosea]TCK71976.1 hypothetical protein C7378_2600 [Acidipila rosea]
MKITIDNFDGKGAVDYSAAVLLAKPLRIARTLNKPTVCSFGVVTAESTLATPARNGRVVIADDTGRTVFTGYVATEPTIELAGMGTAGNVYQAWVQTISDDLLLDMQTVPRTFASAGQSAGVIAAQLTARVDPVRVGTGAVNSAASVGRFLPVEGQSWSQTIGLLSSMTRSAYRVMESSLSLSLVGETVHALSEVEGTLQVKALEASMVRALANDVTVCGALEPCAYVTEFFQGDGTTVLFELTEDPFAPTTAKSKPLIDLFLEPAIDTQIWQLKDAGGHLSLTSTGLTCTGGDGIDGDTTLTAIDQIELGGQLIIEAAGVQLNSGSEGLINALFDGIPSMANCFAGFNVTQVGGANTLTPVIGGVSSGSSFTPMAGRIYTLRLRLYGTEMQRVMESYYSVGDSGVMSYGGNDTACGVKLVFEIQDMTSGVAGAVSVLYDGSVAAAPPVATYGLVDSLNLFCSIRSVTLMQEGPVWVTSTPSGGSARTRRIGTTAQSAECRIERTGKLRFYPASVPQAGELIAVCYRTKHRAVARLASASSIVQQGSNTALPAVAQWAGSVTSPAARSSADCENAALALLNAATSRAAAWKGTYTGWNVDLQTDVWPGDVLAVNAISSGLNANLVVRSVLIEIAEGAPELTKYTISFANDWAEDLGLKLSSHVPPDAWLPQQAATAVTSLENLNTLAVTSVSTTAINISAGVNAPSGGGFEVRRRDWCFAPGTDSDLVLRSPVSNFVIPREAAMEQYYIRMYDGANPPNYSRFSSAIFVNVPL